MSCDDHMNNQVNRHRTVGNYERRLLTSHPFRLISPNGRNWFLYHSILFHTSTITFPVLGRWTMKKNKRNEQKNDLIFLRKEGSPLSLHNLNLMILKIEKKEKRAGS
jgi:hypothetical protein